MEQLYKTIGEYTPDNLIAGQEVPILVKGIKLAKNQGVLVRGTVVGVATSSGLAYPVDKSKADGSQVAKYILTDTINTNGDDDIATTGYQSGLFNKNALVFGGEDTATNHELKLRELGIFLKETVSY